MKIVDASYEILTPISEGGIEELKMIEKAARICYRSENLITEDGESAKKLISNLIKAKHFAMLEHSILSVKFTVDRAIANELVRHRIASFAQESSRYCSYNKDKFGNEISFVDLDWSMGNFPTSNKWDEIDVNKIIDEWKEAMADAERHYMNLMNLGCTAQIARSVLPCSTKTEIVMTCNYREWREVFKLRASSKAHPAMWAIMIPLLDELQEKIPIIFDDIEVN